MSLIINGSRMPKEFNKINAGTVVAVNGLYRIICRAESFSRTCLLSSKANSRYGMD